MYYFRDRISRADFFFVAVGHYSPRNTPVHLCTGAPTPPKNVFSPSLSSRTPPPRRCTHSWLSWTVSVSASTLHPPAPEEGHSLEGHLALLFSRLCCSTDMNKGTKWTLSDPLEYERQHVMGNACAVSAHQLEITAGRPYGSSPSTSPPCCLRGLLRQTPEKHGISLNVLIASTPPPPPPSRNEKVEMHSFFNGELSTLTALNPPQS